MGARACVATQFALFEHQSDGEEVVLIHHPSLDPPFVPPSYHTAPEKESRRSSAARLQNR
jgi:hypothetical protein